MQSVTDAMWVIQQGSCDELDDCCFDAFGQFVLAGVPSTGSHPQPVWLDHLAA
ncbi:MAG TPA: hypothetical protein VF734_07705 [Pseudonocardiaceae bacterium]